MERSSVTPTPHQLRALTHPVRLRILGLLRLDGPATATTLALRLGLNTGATSYHLRQLAQHGFVVDVPERGTGRERWWQAAHPSTRTETGAPTEAPDPADADALDAYLQSVVTVVAEQVQAAIEERPLLPEGWRDASTFSDWNIRLTPASAARLIDTLDELISAQEDDDDPEALHYLVNLNAVVRPGQVGGDPS